MPRLLTSRANFSTSLATLFVALTMLALGPAQPLRAQSATHAAAPAASPASASGGTKKVLSINDYGRWRTIDGAQISADGKWVAYVLRFSNVLPADSKPVIHLRNLTTNQETEIPAASNVTFSPDSRWVVYMLDSVPARAGRGGRGAAPASTDSAATTGRGATAAGTPPRMELRELASGKTESWQNMTSATFSATSSHLLLLRRRAAGGGGRGGAGGGPGGGGRGGAAPAAPAARGTDGILHDLATGRSQHLGSVGDISFNKTGALLAYSVDAEVRDGNGLFVMDLASGRTDALDNDAKLYSHLTWTDDGNGIAILKGKTVDKMREHENVLMVVRDVRASLADPAQAPVIFDPVAAAAFPKGSVVSDRTALTWSEDDKLVFFSIMAQSTAPDTGRRRSADSVPDVDVWRTQDQRIQSQQMIQADADRNLSYREAFDVTAAKYIPLADSTLRELQLSPDGRWAVGRDARAYISDYKRPAADIYRVNPATGERTLMLKGQLTGQHIVGITPDGHRFLYWKDDKYQAYDLDAGTTKTLGGTTAPSFIDTEYDHPGPKPPFGVEAYTSDAKGVIVENKYDLWLLPYDGSPARNLTNGAGAKSEMHLTYARTEPVDETAPRNVRAGNVVDLSRPITLSAYGEYTKKAGFYQLANGELKEIVYDDAAFSTPVRAKHADTYLFTRQTFAEFPDLRVSGPDFKAAKKISDANPQQAEYLWGHRVLFDYKNKKGVRLQGILALPDDYKPGEKRPMLVSFYEKNSQNMNRYSAPSYITGMGSLPMEAVSRGYITMLADVYFNTGSSHSDMLECVEAATKKVIELGYADPKHIGLNGHSYGGEGAAFIATRSRMFAAVGVGAGVTDLFTDFSQSWGWSYQVSGGSGQNGNDYYLYGQGRWGASPWEKPDLYHFESALTHVPEVTEPILIMHGTADPTVSFSEGMNFYNALRYNGKNAILLAYTGEGHGLRGFANRRDLTIRYFQFFDHYLKDAPAPKWMTDEQPFIKKDMTRDAR